MNTTDDRVLDYAQMVDAALRSVAREALNVAAAMGLPGSHQFYLTFRTDETGVEMPDHLRAQFPDEMTIVLEHQFWGLEVEEDFFSVTLSFNRQNTRLSIPFAALTAFVDPSVDFGLQFRGGEAANEPGQDDGPVDISPESEYDPGSTADGPKTENSGAKVIKLDAFQKKPGRKGPGK